MEQYHYQPRLIDDAFSAFLFDDFILSLDERKLIFSTNDLEQLDKFRYELDNYINNKDYSFISEIASLYDKRIRETNLFLNAQQNREYNYGLSESIEFYPNRGYLNPNALAARYKKLIKYKVLSLYLQQADSLTSKAAVDSK
ncbi:hypothetical protein [Carboxylicivirga taeanensis]|uniref:hypothetical protein n=1 Tax=Carboxylicivirga taeanensis TaxID=1416875 RepID=UPI003F6DB18F